MGLQDISADVTSRDEASLTDRNNTWNGCIQTNGKGLGDDLVGSGENRDRAVVVEGGGVTFLEDQRDCSSAEWSRKRATAKADLPDMEKNREESRDLLVELWSKAIHLTVSDSVGVRPNAVTNMLSRRSLGEACGDLMRLAAQ